VHLGWTIRDEAALNALHCRNGRQRARPVARPRNDNVMTINERHVVVGAGVSGCVAAIMKKRAGYDVTILERNRSTDDLVLPIGTETCNIVSENHSGAEYPYDPQSARDCLDGRLQNERFFPSFIYGGKVTSRVLASRSMIEAGHDIAMQCRSNMEVLRKHYAQRIAENFLNYTFGNPDSAFRESAPPAGVRDVEAAFLTPQRGFNTLYVGLVLQHELRRLGIEFIQGADVQSVQPRSERFEIEYVKDGGRQALVADQVSICAAAYGFALAKRLNPRLELPDIHLALRCIIYCDLPDGCDKNFTCLKLEDKYGAMLSPLGPNTALVYHPPAAHISWKRLSESGEFPTEYRRAIAAEHPEVAERAQQTLHEARKYYPELARASIVSRHVSVAINTTSDSRQRRNMGVFKIVDGCNMMILPKWTMAVADAKKDLVLALEHSVRRGTLHEDDVCELLLELLRVRVEVPGAWLTTQAPYLTSAKALARLMRVPEDIAWGLAKHGSEAAHRWVTDCQAGVEA